MENINTSTLEEILGITSPWGISAVSMDHRARTLVIDIESNDKKKRFGLLAGSKTKPEGFTKGTWQYQNVGNYTSFIRADVVSKPADRPVTLDQLSAPAFIGHPQRRYSNWLRQCIALSEVQGLSMSQICKLYRLDTKTLEQIRQDIQSAETTIRSLVCLPTQVDVVWHRVLTDKQNIKTNLFSLKLLLSKLKLAAARTTNASELASLSQQLQKFFIANAQLAEHEIDQLCGLTNDNMARRVAVGKQRQKLVLPAIKNPVWIDLLTGKLNLNSKTVPLNLLLSRQRVKFLHAASNDVRIVTINTIRDYFKKNHRVLKPELLLINRAMAINSRATVRLPNPDHAVWQQLLSRDDFIATNNVAYKLLLSKLRAKIHASHDPVVKLEAARSIRSFIKQNHRTLKRELSDIVQQSEAI